MILIDGKPYGEIPKGEGWLGRFTSWLQRKTQKPLGAYQPVYARVGFSRSVDGHWVPPYSWRGWYYDGKYDPRERLIRNGVWFVRYAKPFDFVLGWRPNGVFGASFRFQTDVTSSVVDDPDQDLTNNLGQAQGFMEGWR